MSIHSYIKIDNTFPIRTHDNTGKNTIKNQILIQAKEFTTIGLFYTFISKKLKFPFYFSRNLDSFDEIINDFSWLPPSEIHIIIIGYECFLKNESEIVRLKLMKVLINATEEQRFEIYLNDCSQAVIDLNEIGSNYSLVNLNLINRNKP